MHYNFIRQGYQVQKYKKAKFGHKQFQKGKILTNEKKPIFALKFVETTRFKVRMSTNIVSFAPIFPK